MSFPSQIMPTSAGAVVASSRGTNINSGSGAGVKSSAWTQLIASTDYDSCGLYVYCYNGNGGICTVELATGASGSELSLGADVAFGAEAFHLGANYVPICIPAGTRISAKTSAVGSTNIISVSLSLIRGAVHKLAYRGRIYGYASGALTQVDGGASANTKSAYVQLSASTTADAKGYTLLIATDSASTTSATFLTDLALGAAASEVIITGDVLAGTHAFAGGAGPTVLGPIWTPIPAASRIAVRVAASTSTAVDRKLRVGLILWE